MSIVIKRYTYRITKTIKKYIDTLKYKGTGDKIKTDFGFEL